MANKEHLSILKQGATAWNQWRELHPEIDHLDLTDADLRNADLRSASLGGTDLSNSNLGGANLDSAHLNRAQMSRTHLSGAYLYRAKLGATDLSHSDLTDANLGDADLSGANLHKALVHGAYLVRADLMWTTLTQADLREADLSGADLTDADLSGAMLHNAVLNETDFSGANLENAALNNCSMRRTKLTDIDLSSAKGLETINHQGPSPISIGTIYFSQGRIPEIFMRGAGVPEPFIANVRSLVAAMEPVQFYSCFISYSSKDQHVAVRLHADLQSNGVRCWFAPEDLKIGAKLRDSFDEAIRLHDKLLVVLSEHSVNSAWVEKEVETAFEKERQQNRTVLFPILLDDAVMETKQAWAADIRRTRHIGNFRQWKDHQSYEDAFRRLLRDLRAEGKAQSATQK